MPELPEVQTVVSELVARGVPGLAISGVTVSVPALVGPRSVPEFQALLQGRRILALRRRAKYIVAELEGGLYWISHLRMSGHFVVIPGEEGTGRFERARISLSDGRALRYDDIRKFGRFVVTGRPEEVLGKLGPEPLEEGFTGPALFGLLQAGGRKTCCIKAWLLNQENLAGLGNIYVDEALWTARIHPERPAASLDRKEAAALCAAIRKVLRKGIANSGTSLGHTQGNFIKADGKHGSNQDTLNVFQRKGKPCPRCGAIIEKTVVAQRGTHTCPNCQKKSK